ncbi:hypothetical protein V6W75_07265 [Mannheimia sp. HC-2023]|uniref:hypothetical protein n=1 Tax=Mannheimia indoligenes TaxID=3103145 RepID=UPI002FE6BB2F
MSTLVLFSYKRSIMLDILQILVVNQLLVWYERGCSHHYAELYYRLDQRYDVNTHYQNELSISKKSDLMGSGFSLSARIDNFL